MKRSQMVTALAVVNLVFGGFAAAQDSGAAGQKPASSQSTHWYSPARYNPLKLVKRDSKTASEQLAENSEQTERLTSQLQAHRLLPAGASLKDACASFKTVNDCVAALHASRNVTIKFDCLKWNLTAVKSGSVGSSCIPPEDGKPMSLVKAIRALKPDVDAKAEAKTAERQARDDISDATL